MLGIFRPSAEVEIYKVAVQITLLTSFDLQAMNIVGASRFAAFYVEREINRLQRLSTSGAQAVLVFNFLFFLLQVLVGEVYEIWDILVEYEKRLRNELIFVLIAKGDQ